MIVMSLMVNLLMLKTCISQSTCCYNYHCVPNVIACAVTSSPVVARKIIITLFRFEFTLLKQRMNIYHAQRLFLGKDLTFVSGYGFENSLASNISTGTLMVKMWI